MMPAGKSESGTREVTVETVIDLRRRAVDRVLVDHPIPVPTPYGGRLVDLAETVAPEHTP